MKKLPKIILLLVVLAPSVFFISQSMAGNEAYIKDGKLEVTGPGKFKLAFADIKTINLVDSLPALSGTPGFSLGLVKKGNFIRSSDEKTIRVVKNRETPFIHIVSSNKEFYFNFKGELYTKDVYDQLTNNQ